MEVGLGQGHIVLDRDPAPTKRGSPHFSAHVSPISATFELLFGEVRMKRQNKRIKRLRD